MAAASAVVENAAFGQGGGGPVIFRLDSSPFRMCPSPLLPLALLLLLALSARV
ncbi:MAG: hypothetical protein U1U88_001274 [Lawsonella clevelandensis]